MDQIVWLNSCITINKRPFFWKRCFESGVVKIGDMYCNNKLRSANEMGINWLELEQLVNAIPDDWKYLIDQGCDGDIEIDLFSVLLNSVTTRNKKVYDMLIDDHLAVLKYYDRWINCTNQFNLSYDDYLNEFNRLYQYTKRTKFRDFQYRLLLLKIITNTDLYEWGLISYDYCEFCKVSIETTTHLFFECPKIQPLLLYFYEELGKKNGINLENNMLSFLFSHVHEKASHIMNFVCTFLKQFIYKTRCSKTQPNVIKFIKELEYYHTIEKQIAISESRLMNHYRVWSPIVEFGDL